MKYLFNTCFLVLLYCGCSSHKIILSVPQKINEHKEHYCIGIYSPQKVHTQTYYATTTGGSCAGHEFQIFLGDAVFSTVQSAVEYICDSTAYFSTLPDTIPKNIKYILIPEIGKKMANADYSNGLTTVTIHANFEQEIDLRIKDHSGKEIVLWHLDTKAQSWGEGGCHDGVIYLKKAGEIAMVQLRDSIISKLLSLPK